jgi:hypothetical protein
MSACVHSLVGATVVGRDVGARVGLAVGDRVGDRVARVGERVGAKVGIIVGSRVGAWGPAAARQYGTFLRCLYILVYTDYDADYAMTCA